MLSAQISRVTRRISLAAGAIAALALAPVEARAQANARVDSAAARVMVLADEYVREYKARLREQVERWIAAQKAR